MSKSKQLAQPLTYLCESAGVQVDETNGIIRGVKVLGAKSVNHRRYTPEAISKAQQLYEGASVYVNHPKRPGDSRDYNDRGGFLKSTRIVEGELFADLHTNPNSERGKQLLWEAKNCPTTFGLSHTAHGYGRQVGDTWVCEEIAQVHSVDIVTRPATTKGLFESEGSMDGMDAGGAPVETQSPTAAVEDSFRNAIIAVVDGEGDDKDKLAKIKGLLKAKTDAIAAVTGESTTETPAPSGDAAPVTESVKTKTPAGAVALTEEQRELRQLRAEKTARGLLESAGVDCKPEWVAAVAALSESQREPFIKTLKTATPGSRPRSGGKPLSESAGNAQPAMAFANGEQRASYLRG